METRLEVLGQKSLSVILDEVEQRANAATRGPWECAEHAYKTDDGEGYQFTEGDWHIFPPMGESGPIAVVSGESNMRAVAAARSDVPALVKALRRAVKTLKAYADKPKFGIDAPWALLNIKQILLGTEDVQDSSAQDAVDRATDKLLSEPAGSVPFGKRTLAEQCKDELLGDKL